MVLLNFSNSDGLYQVYFISLIQIIQVSIVTVDHKYQISNNFCKNWANIEIVTFFVAMTGHIFFVGLRFMTTK